jgi:membrane dipeptidase
MLLHRRNVVGRREFLACAGATAAVAAVHPWTTLARQAGTTPFPYVDGLTFVHPDDYADGPRSGLSAFICGVSSGAVLKTDDGSLKYWRSFEPCVRSMTAMRRNLAAGKVAGTFLATRGSEITEAWRDDRTAMFFQLQGGGEAVGEHLWRLDTFHELGLRVFQITHHNDNEWGGGAIEKTWTDLTKLGHEGVERLNELRIIPDLSHVSDPTSLDVLKASRRPVILWHGAARALVHNARCAPDEVIRGVGASGGVMGIFMMSFWLTTDRVHTVESYIPQIRHVINGAGIDAVGIANDYPIGGEASALKVGNDNAKAVEGYYRWRDDVAKQGVLGFDRRPSRVVIPELNNLRRMFLIHEALERAGFKAAEIEKIMGGHWIRVLTESLQTTD